MRKETELIRTTPSINHSKIVDIKIMQKKAAEKCF